MDRGLEILKGREKRYNDIVDLLKKYPENLIALKCNYPGDVKVDRYTKKILEIESRYIENTFKGEIILRKKNKNPDGEYILYVVEGDIREIKSRCIEIEGGSPLGRLVDIDVYDKEGRGISRVDVGRKRRRCYLCDRDANLCVRERTHPLEDIKGYIWKAVDEVEV